MSNIEKLYRHLNRLVESTSYYLVYKDKHCFNDLINDLNQSQKLLRKVKNESKTFSI